MQRALLLAMLGLTFMAGGCSVRRFAVKKAGDAIASSGTTFSSDGHSLAGLVWPLSF